MNEPYVGAIAYLGGEQVMITHVEGRSLEWCYMADMYGPIDQDSFRDLWGNDRFHKERTDGGQY